MGTNEQENQNTEQLEAGAPEPKVNKFAKKPAYKAKESTTMEGLFKELDDINEDGGFLEDITLSNVEGWYDTGCYALNAIISGSLFGGVQKGRIIGFSGPSGCGKTLIINRILANAQKSGGLWAAIFDSEAAVDKQSAVNVGLDPKKTKYYPVQTVNDCKHQVMKLLDNIIASPSMHGKVIISIDSLGNLSTNKELNDAVEGKDAAEMGLKSKQLRAMLRVLTYKAAKAGVTILFSNHTYEDPAAMHPSIIKKQSGGGGPVYTASVLVQLAQSNDRIDEDEDAPRIEEAKGYNGVTLNALTIKNRFVPPFLSAKLNNNFLTGLNKYSGVIDLAINYKVIEGDRTYTYKGEKIGYRKNFENDITLLERILPELEVKIKEKYKFNASANNSEKPVEVFPAIV